MDEGVHYEGSAECIEVEDVEDVVFMHEGLCVRVVPFTSPLYEWWHTADEANDFLVENMEWLEIGCVGF